MAEESRYSFFLCGPCCSHHWCGNAGRPRPDFFCSRGFRGSGGRHQRQKNSNIINRGGSALNLHAPVLAGADFSVTTPLPLTTLAPGSRTSLTLRFTASSPGPATAGFSMESNAPGNSFVALILRGSGLPLPGLPFGSSNESPILSTLQSGGTQVEFQAIAGRTYLLQSRFDLLSWPYVRQVMADEGGAILYTDGDPRSPRAFYRIQAE